MFDGSMSESTNKAAVNVRSRLFLALPLVLFAFVALTVGFVAGKTLRQPYRTALLVIGGLFSVQDEVVLDFNLTGACRLDTSSNC